MVHFDPVAAVAFELEVLDVAAMACRWVAYAGAVSTGTPSGPTRTSYAGGGGGLGASDP